jgi:hypothetical protein
MARRGATYTPNPGSVSVLCPGPVCGRRISPSQLCCGGCWGSLDRALKSAYLAAKASGTAAELETSRKAITDHLASQTAGER